MLNTVRIASPLGIRALPAIALAMALHALILLSARPTLLGGMSVATPPAMTVRVLRAEPGSVSSSEILASEPTRSLNSSSEPGRPGVLPSPASEKPVHDQPSSRVGAPERPIPTAKLPADTGVAAAPVLAETTATPTRAAAALPDAATPPALQVGLPPAPAYLPSGKLDPGPRPLHDIEPAYPDDGNLRQGSVVLRLLINESGEVDNAAVVRAIPQGVFERSALAAFSAARFAPGRFLGVAVKSQLTIEVEFMPINRGARVSGRAY